MTAYLTVYNSARAGAWSGHRQGIQQVQQGWIKGRMAEGRTAKLYSLTAAGQKQFGKELENWDRFRAT